MYEYFMNEICQKEAERKSRMEKAAKDSIRSHSTSPPPTNFKYDVTKVCI